MAAKIKILILEHNADDIELMLLELKKAGIDFVSEIVETEQDYCNALINFIPDLILSDFSLPSFDGENAFKIREKLTPDTPFIFVSGTIGEENSIEFLKNGVTDYALKDKLFTLAVKVRRALAEAKEKQQKNKTEQELAQSEMRLSRAQQLAHMGSWEIDMVNNIQTWSDEMYKIFGIDHSEQVSTELFLSFIHKDDRAFSTGHVEKAYATLSDGSFNFRFTRKDGEMRYGYTEYRFEFDQHKVPLRLYGIVHDISDKKKAEENLEQSENRFRGLIEKSTDMKTLATSDGEMIYASPSITKVLGYSMEEFLHTSSFSFIHPDDIVVFTEKRKDILLTPGKSFYNQNRFRHKNGSWIWCEGTVTNMLHESGIHALVSNFRDISEKKEAEQNQQFDKNNLNALINNTKDLMWSVDRDFRLITANQPFDDSVRHLSGNTIARGSSVFSKGFSEEQLKKYKGIYERAFSGEAFTELEYGDKPREFWLEISYNPIRKGDEVIGSACHSRDITESKKAEESLIKSEALLKEAQAFALTSNWEIDMIRNIHTWSDELYNIFRIKKEEMQPSTESFLSFMHQDDVIAVREGIKESFATLKASSYNFRFIRKDGEMRYGHVERKFELDKNNKPVRLFGIFQDVTEKKSIEAEREKITADLLQRNKDLEQFTYIVSHNLRAPVANIMGISDALRTMNLEEEEKEEMMYSLSASVLKLNGVIKDLNHILQTRRDVSEKREIVSFSHLIKNIKISIDDQIKQEQVEIKTDFSEVDKMLTLKSFLYSIFYNLISNSIKYRQAHLLPVIEIKSYQLKDGIELHYSDNGLGIDMKKRGDQVFGMYKRFHTHKEGKGMGMFMVKTHVETLGGKISIESEVNKGTKFIIQFPL